MAQGGISKATKGLNLSEDVFAGMDAQLRGRTVVHRGYFQVRSTRAPIELLSGLISLFVWGRLTSSGPI
eukprot:2432640-Prymnesium_polylepis.2